MKIALSYLAIPILLALVLAAYGFVAHDADIPALLVMVSGGAFFYGAPYFVWALVHFVLKPRNAVVHSGYIVATLALALISSMWLLPGYPSGLPLQWMVYWPLAFALILVFAGSSAALAWWRRS